MRSFTLIELSIVLVIVGLIVAGVTAGQSLIKAAGINATIREVNEMRTQLNAFQLKYGAVPGDFDEANEYFSSCTNNGGNTCNGDGNFQVGSGGVA